MNNVISLVQASRHPFSPSAAVSAESMSAELLTLHEDMVSQLRLERLSGVGSAEFIRGMVAQHESAAAMLRAQLEHREAAQPESRFGPFQNSPQQL